MYSRTAFFAISDDMELYTEFGYSKKKSIYSTTPSEVSGSWGSPQGRVNANLGDGATTLGASHPDNTFGAEGQFRYAAGDVGPRTNTIDNASTRFLVGIKGNAGAWNYDIAYLHSQTSLDSVRTGYLLYNRVRQALTDGANNRIGWWRIGANAHLNSQAVYDYISPRIDASSSTQLDVFDAKASRSLATLRGGSLGLAVGFEYHRLTARLTPFDFTNTGNVIGLDYTAYDGTEEAAAAYAELSAPLLKSLELTGAFRADKYKDGGAVASPKIGFRWKPLEWMAVRGTYAESFRAPSPVETQGSSVRVAATTDLVRCGFSKNTPACHVPIAFIGRPNPDLDPEESKSYTVGLVLDPTPNTSIALNAWKIKRIHEIVQDNTFAAVAKGNDIRAGDLWLGVPGSGTLLAIIAPYDNAGSTTVHGVDLNARHIVDFEQYGKLMFDLQWSRINSFEQIENTGLKHQYAGTHGNCNITDCIGIPKDRINFGVTWTQEDWSISGVVNYIGKFDNTLEQYVFETVDPYFDPSPTNPIVKKDAPCTTRFADGADAPGGCEIKAFYTLDLSARWSPIDAWEFFGSIQNVTDRIAPLDPTTHGSLNYNSLHSSGAIGRYFTLGARYTFK